MLINYKTREIFCLTRCPFKMRSDKTTINLVGSLTCTDCYNFISIDCDKKQVNCKLKLNKHNRNKANKEIDWRSIKKSISNFFKYNIHSFI